MGLRVLSDLLIGSLRFPSSDGTNGQVLKTDGSGNLSFATVSTSDTKVSSLSFNTASGVLTATLSDASTATVDLDGRYALASHTHTYDNYQSWNLKTNGVQRTTVQSGGTLDLVAGSNVTLSYGAGGVVTIASTYTNNYADAVSFNTTTGVLTVGRNGSLADLTVNLDGRYLTSVTAHTHAIGDIVDLETTLNRTVVGASASNDTITFTRADGTTFTVTTSDADTNNYADSVAFNTTTGVLTIGRNGSLADLTVDLDGRYLTGVPAEYLTQTEGDTLYQPIGSYQAAGTYNTIIGTDTDISTTGATIVGSLTMTDGVITAHTTRTLTLANLGYTGSTTADNYGSWTISDGTNTEAIGSGASLKVVGTGATRVGYDASTNTLTVDSTDTDTNTDTNYYLSGAAFNTTNGVLTLTVTGAANQTVDLDGRYAYSSHTHSYLPLAGGSLTGDLDLTGANPQIRWVPTGTNDAAGIRFNYTNNDGVMEFWTSDDYSEPFVWRAYDVGVNGTGTYQEWMKLERGVLYVDGNTVATESYVTTAISNLVASAPTTLDTLNELAAALGDDPNFATTVTTSIGNKLDASVNPIVSATVSNDTTTYTKADGTTFALTTSDANSDTYVTGASFSTTTGVLTLTRNSGSVTVDLDGRYLESLPAHTHAIADVTGLGDELSRALMNASVSNDTITFTRGDGTTFTVTTSDANTNYYLNGISRTAGTDTLVFSVSGTTNQSYTFGSNAFTSYTDHTAAGYLAASSYTAADVLAKIKTVDGAGSGLDADTLDGLSSGSFLRSDASNGNIRVTAGNGTGLRFWDSDAYKIWMSSTGDTTWGGKLDPNSDYNMYFKMGGGTNRGFVFRNDAASVAQIDGRGIVYTASTGDSTNWQEAYDNYITGIAVTGTSTKTITLTQRDGGTITATFSDIDTDTNTWRGIHDTPVDGATTTSISSNWAFDNVKTAVPAGAVFTDTTYSVRDGGLTEINFTSALKTKLDGIAASANNYSLPAGSSTVRGGFKIGYTESGKNYPVEVLNEQMYVNVPWTDNNTTYSVGDGGLTQVNFTTAFRDKLNGIAASANNYSHPTQTAISASGTGATVVDGVTVNTLGHTTAVSTRTLTLANLGYTGATNANYITNNNQLTNGAGYLTSSNDRVYITDSRGAVRAPSYYDDRYAQFDFQNTVDTGIDGDGWQALLTVSKWSAFDPSHRQEQIIFAGDNLWRRTASSDTAWGDNKVIWDSGNINPIVSATVSNDTTTYVKADGTSFALTTSDANSNTYVTSASFNTADGVLTLTRNSGSVTVDIDGRYLQSITSANVTTALGYTPLSTTGKAADSNLLDGLDLHTGRNNEVNKVVRTDASGYIQAGWINTTSGATTSTLTKIYASQDDYLRYVTPAEFRRQITDGVYAPASHTHAYDNYGSWTISDGARSETVTSGYALTVRGAGATEVVFDPATNILTINSTDTNTDTNTTYTADGNYGLTLSGTTFRLEDDRRRNSSTTDIYTGNTHDFTWYDADIGIRWYTAGAEEMRLLDNGTLHVDGDVIAYSTTVSDASFKDDVVTIDNALDKIKRLRGVEYTWNTGSRKGKRDLGLIAQEVQEVLPEIVHEHEMPLMEDAEAGKAYKTVDYEKMVGVLIEAMKEQQVQIDSLKAEVAALKGK